MRTVFLDTVGMIGLWDEDDQWNTAASAAMQLLVQQRCRLVTSTYVLLECGNAAARRTYRGDVVRMRDELGLAGNVYEPTIVDIFQAWESYSRGYGGNAGIVDQSSFVIMCRLGISDAFTNDWHFGAAGFNVLF